MKLIAHRGNINGKESSNENKQDYIENAICLNYDVEVDVWYINGDYFLGHDGPEHKTSIEFLEYNRHHLWIHCKNLESMYRLKDTFNCFFHNTDDAVLTSNNYIWTFPGKLLMPNSIAVLPEGIYTKEQLKKCFGICSDFIGEYND